MYFRWREVWLAVGVGAVLGMAVGWLAHGRVARPDDDLLRDLDRTRLEYEGRMANLERSAAEAAAEAAAALAGAETRLAAFEALEATYPVPPPEPPPVALPDVLEGESMGPESGPEPEVVALRRENRELRAWGKALEDALANRTRAVEVLREAVERLETGTAALMTEVDAQRERARIAERRVRQYDRVRWMDYTYVGPCVFAGRGSWTAGWGLEDSQSQSFGVGAGVCVGVNLMGVLG